MCSKIENKYDDNDWREAVYALADEVEAILTDEAVAIDSQADDLAEAINALRPSAGLADHQINPRYDPAFVSAEFTFEDCVHAKEIVEKHK